MFGHRRYRSVTSRRRWPPGFTMRVALMGVVMACGLSAGCADEPASAPRPDPQRLVVLSPAAAEMLDRLGLGDRVVGIGEFGPWPPRLATLPVVGGYDSPNVEQAVRLGAQALINTKSQAATAAHRRLEILGIEVIALDTSTYDGVFQSLMRVGERFGRGEAARTITARLQGELQAIRLQSQGIPERRVLFVVGRDPLYVAGPGSHIDRLIRMTGGINVAHDAHSPYQQISMETILERRPEVIIDTSQNFAGAPRGRQPGTWRRWDFLPAVRDNRVHWVDPSQLVIPGLRLPDMARLMGKLIHPEVFGSPRREDYLELQ